MYEQSVGGTQRNRKNLEGLDRRHFRLGPVFNLIDISRRMASEWLFVFPASGWWRIRDPQRWLFRICFRFPASAVLIFISIFICKHISPCFRVSLQLAYPNGNPCRQHSLLNLILILGPEFPVGDQACCCTCAASYQGLSGTVFTFSGDSRWQGSPVFIIVVAPRQLMEQPIPLKVSRWTAGSKKHNPKLAFWTHYRTQNKNSYGNKLKA